jgi:hypothetical protein
MERHPGIRIDQIPVEGAAGLIFVVGILLIGYFGLPAYRWYFLSFLVVGALGGVALHLWREFR